ncbi:MAG: hypothetical protein ACE5GV_02275 [Candidatus Scalindua sp.]
MKKDIKKTLEKFCKEAEATKKTALAKKTTIKKTKTKKRVRK